MKTKPFRYLGILLSGLLLAGCDASNKAKPSLTITAEPNVTAYVGEPVTINGQLANPPAGALVEFTAQPGRCEPAKSESSSTIFYPVEPGPALITARLVLNGKTLTSASTSVRVEKRVAVPVVPPGSSQPVAATESAVGTQAPSLSKILTDWTPASRPAAGAYHGTGAATLEESYERDPRKGDVVRIRYDVSSPESYAGFWTKWPSLDGVGSKWTALQLDLRGSADSTTRLKIEIKAKTFGVRAAYVTGIAPNEWRTITLPLASFRTVRSDYNDSLDEIVLTFEQRFVDYSKGTIYLGKMALVAQ